MKNELYVSDDAPEELKEVISAAQRMMDNMVKFKAKAEDGTLTLDDLDELTRLNNNIARDFPRANTLPVGYPPQTSDIEELKAISRSRAAEAEAELKAGGGPVLNIQTLEELEELSKQSPESLAATVMAAAQAKKRAESSETGDDDPIDAAPPSLEQQFSTHLIKENLDRIHDLLVSAKLVLFDRQEDWRTVKPFEKELHLNAKAFEGNKQEGIDLLLGILRDEEEDEDLVDRQAEAAYNLATIANEQTAILDDLAALWEKDEERGKPILKALKYATNPFIPRWILSRFHSHGDSLKPGLLEVLDYQGAFDCAYWEKQYAYQGEYTQATLYRITATSGVVLSREQADPLLSDPNAAHFEEAFQAELLSGRDQSLMTARNHLYQAPDKTRHLAMILACGAEETDAILIRRSLQHESIRDSVVSALGILGLPQFVCDLINIMDPNITSKADWDYQRLLVENLELITGAEMELDLPEINEGPEGREIEVTVEVGWKYQWADWWYQNRHRFETNARYRRGKRFTLESCISEMGHRSGSYWTRQRAYYELQMRSGQHIAPFFADWPVHRQLESIRTWQHWWEQNRYEYPDHQWLFNGR